MQRVWEEGEHGRRIYRHRKVSSYGLPAASHEVSFLVFLYLKYLKINYLLEKKRHISNIFIYMP